ncbi:cytosine permease [Vibrio sp. SCSIO 43136]|uniref:cytosine permease n=1 Tax=Vibrio sp. SCSIO 43136 TaxID=2819101 RepID=UPI002075DC92|nr:cytosine permease [Vibrio sp. SCSIO 43136]USD68260.1 cytosine permease [Vibrio sp. SCSIO 43136]
MIFDDEYGLRPVPHYARKRALPLALVFIAFTIFSASMHAGGSLYQQTSSDEFIAVVLIGNLVLGVYTAFLARIAVTTGLSTHLLAHFSFGTKGSKLPSLLLGGTQVGWFGVGVAMLAIPVNAATGVDVNLLIVISGALMIATAHFGISSLIFLSAIAVPLFLLLSGSSLAQVGQDTIVNVFRSDESEAGVAMSYTAGLSIVIGSFISASTLTADFARFFRTYRIAMLVVLMAYLLGNSLTFFIGAIGVSSLGYPDLFDMMLAQGLLIPAIVVLGLNIWTTNDCALYASGLALTNITQKPSNWMAMINGVIGTVMALWIYNHFIEWLSFLSHTLPPIGGILIADYLRNKKRYHYFNDMEIEAFHWPGIAALGVAVVLASLLPGVVPINGIIVAALSYWLFDRIAKS